MTEKDIAEVKAEEETVETFEFTDEDGHEHCFVVESRFKVGKDDYAALLEVDPAIFKEEYEECDCGHAHEHDHGHEHASSHGEECGCGHDHGEAYNAHIWLAPQNAVQMVKNLRDGLSELLPDKAAQISANAEQYIARLEALDAELREAIAALPNKKIVTFHEAFPYFAKAYGLEVAAVVALEPDEPISPRMLKRVIQQVKEAGNPPLFSEPQYENTALRTVAQETGARVYELDPLVTGDGALTAYEDTMRRNLDVLRQALGESK